MVGVIVGFVPRKIRIQYPGAMYHIMSRGDRRENIFLDDVDRQDFLKTLAEACQKTGWQVHAYCLMSNHYHVVLETPNANLLPGMAWLQSTYTIRLNHRHKLIGHVLSGRLFKAQLLEKIDGKLGEHHSGQLHRESAQAKAERIIAEELQRAGWQQNDLAFRAKSDPMKLRIATRVRNETTLSIKEIAARLHLGTSKSANVRLHATPVDNSHQAAQANLAL